MSDLPVEDARNKETEEAPVWVRNDYVKWEVNVKWERQPT